jgi:hypothetical protein
MRAVGRVLMFRCQLMDQFEVSESENSHIKRVEDKEYRGFVLCEIETGGFVVVRVEYCLGVDIVWKC